METTRKLPLVIMFDYTRKYLASVVISSHDAWKETVFTRRLDLKLDKVLTPF